jgi:hypothetical protein
MISLNLADRYFGRKQDVSDYLSKVKKGGVQQLLFGDP